MTDPVIIEQCLREALAWGKVYGPVISTAQWQGMCDTQIRQHLATILGKPVEEITLTHRCPTPEKPRTFDLGGPTFTQSYWDCPECRQIWFWNGTGWYKTTKEIPHGR